MVRVEKKEHESVDALLRRFKKKVQQSGVLIRARRNQFYQPPKSKQLRRVSAIRRKERQDEMERLHKLGKLDQAALMKRPKR